MVVIVEIRNKFIAYLS